MDTIAGTIIKSIIFLTLFMSVVVVVSGCTTVVTTLDCIGVSDNEAEIAR